MCKTQYIDSLPTHIITPVIYILQANEQNLQKLLAKILQNISLRHATLQNTCKTAFLCLHHRFNALNNCIQSICSLIFSFSPSLPSSPQYLVNTWVILTFFSMIFEVVFPLSGLCPKCPDRIFHPVLAPKNLFFAPYKSYFKCSVCVFIFCKCVFIRNLVLKSSYRAIYIII